MLQLNAPWIAMAVVVLAALPARSARAEKLLVSQERGYSITFPADPKEEVYKPSRKEIVEDIEYSVVHEGLYYSLRYTTYSQELVDSLGEPTAFMKRHKQSTAKNSTGEVISQEELTLGKDAIPGYELLIDLKKEQALRHRVFFRAGRLYQTMTIGPRALATGKSADRYHESLAVSSPTDGWVSLFNGKDLTGWKANEKGKWTVEDGCIVTPNQRSHLFHDKEFQNFDFKADVQTSPGSNSGIYFHTAYIDGLPNRGIECQINCTNNDPVKNGSLYYLVKNGDPISKDNEWFQVRIRVQGKTARTWINDTLVADYTEPSDVQGNHRLGKGAFALQARGTNQTVRFRKLQVRELSENDPAN